MSKAGLKEQIRATEDRIARLKRELEVEEIVLARLRAARDGLGLGMSGRVSRRKPRAITGGSLLAVARDVLKLEGRAMSLDELVKELEKRGVRSGWKRGLGPAITSALSRRPDIFKRVSRGKYALVDLGPSQTNLGEP